MKEERRKLYFIEVEKVLSGVGLGLRFVCVEFEVFVRFLKGRVV